MHYTAYRGWNIDDGEYVAESIYPIRKPTSRQNIKVKDGKVYSDILKYTLSVKDFFHDHEIVPNG